MAFEKRSVRLGGLWLAMAAGATMTGASASAQLIALEQFVYPQGAPLTAVTPGGIGWTGGWNAAAPGAWTIDSQGSAYSKGFFRLQTAGNRIHGSRAVDQRTFANNLTLGNVTETVWVSFIAQQTYGASNANWLGVNFPCTGPNSFLFVGKPYSRAAWGFDAGSIGSHRVGTKSPYQKAFIVARFDLRGGGAFDDVTMWVNPRPGTTPVNASEVLSLPNYGNFEGMTKAIVEIGSTSGLTTGHLDELRIGRSYASVAPSRPGLLFRGFQHETLGQAILENTSPDMIRISNIGGTGQDGVLVDMGGASGAAFKIAPGDLGNTTGRVVTTRFDASGEPLVVHSSRGMADGRIAVEVDFNAVGAAGVGYKLFNSSGDLVAEGTTSRDRINYLVIGGNCEPPQVAHWVYVLSPDGTSLSGTYQGCFLPDIPFQGPWGTLPGASLELSALGGTSPAPGGLISVTASNVSSFGVFDVSITQADLAFSGAGAAVLEEACDGGACGAASVLMHNEGTDGDDGIVARRRDGRSGDRAEIKLDASAMDANPAGVIETTFEVVTTLGDVRHVSARLVPDGSDRMTMTLDFSDVGASLMEYTVSNNGTVVGAGQGALLAVSIPKYINQWVKFWCERGGLHWPGLSAQFEHYGAIVVGGGGGGGGGGTYEGNQIDIHFADGSAIQSITEVSVSGSELAGPLAVSDVEILAVAQCRADFNADGFVDFFDYDGFVGAFEAGTSDADFNADGFLDFFDYIDFVGAFEVGC